MVLELKSSGINLSLTKKNLLELSIRNLTMVAKKVS